jgi:FKBP-type peptidyl-prolyl cis-trans isomerase FkpA
VTEITAVPLRPVKKGAVTWLWAGVAAAVLGAGAVAWAGTPTTVTSPTGLRYSVLKAGTGAHPTDTDFVLVKYKGTLKDGTVFDQQDRAPFPVNAVVPGFSEGLKVMQKGGKYRLWIPPQLGYGAQQTGPIPANSELIFDVELLDIRSQAEVQRQMMQQQLQQQMQGGPPPQR